MGSLSFASLSFLAAGMLCAAAPLVIHLLNRRRYRVVQWAAMDFLRQALQRNRKILQLRDLLLLVLRTLAILFFGAALARPYLADGQQSTDQRQPLHVTIIVDNSLSMAYETLDGTLLEKARQRAGELVEQLPAGSLFTILPACGSRDPLVFDPLETKERANEALDRLEIVDRTAPIGQMARLAQRAIEAAPQFTKRIALFTDQQALNWRDARESNPFYGLPSVQIISVGAGTRENSWIADLSVEDGLADLETPTTVVVSVSHQGHATPQDIQVTLSLGEIVLGQQSIALEPHTATRDVTFECSLRGLTGPPQPGEVVFAPLKAAITPDRLPADDQRYLAVPIVAALPVIFVDQYGASGEEAARGRLGETRHLRKLLAPRTTRAEAPHQLIRVFHVTPPELTSDLLENARLVVVAGLREPGPATELLARFVNEGGQLFVGAGADFDTVAWQSAAWRDGNGILPLPLLPTPIGCTPEEGAGKLEPFQLSFDSLAGAHLFKLAGVADAELKSLYAEPYFFKAVHVDDSPAVLEKLRQIDTAPPSVLARFDRPANPPFLVSRKIGKGQVLFCSSGLLSSWNTLPKTNTVLMFDRLLRTLVQDTLPQQNVAPAESLTVPLPATGSNISVTLTRPGQTIAEPLETTYTGAQQRGVQVTGLLQRGIYWLRASRPAAMPGAPSGAPAWELPLVVGGDPQESDLTAIAGRDLPRADDGSNVRVLADDERIDLAGDAARGQGSWWWLTVCVLGLLATEMVIVVLPAFLFAPSLST